MADTKRMKVMLAILGVLVVVFVGRMFLGGGGDGGDSGSPARPTATTVATVPGAGDPAGGEDDGSAPVGGGGVEGDPARNPFDPAG